MPGLIRLIGKARRYCPHGVRRGEASEIRGRRPQCRLVHVRPRRKNATAFMPAGSGAGQVFAGKACAQIPLIWNADDRAEQSDSPRAERRLGERFPAVPVGGGVLAGPTRDGRVDGPRGPAAPVGWSRPCRRASDDEIPVTALDAGDRDVGAGGFGCPA